MCDIWKIWIPKKKIYGEKNASLISEKAYLKISHFDHSILSLHFFHTDISKNRSFMLSTLGFTCVAFVTGALAWWGPSFMLKGLLLQKGNENMKLDEWVLFYMKNTFIFLFFIIYQQLFTHNKFSIQNRDNPCVFKSINVHAQNFILSFNSQCKCPKFFF